MLRDDDGDSGDSSPEMPEEEEGEEGEEEEEEVRVPQRSGVPAARVSGLRSIREEAEPRRTEEQELDEGDQHLREHNGDNDAYADYDPDTHPDTYSDTHPEPHPDSHPDTHPGTHSDSHPDPPPDPDTYPDFHSDPSDLNPGTAPYRHANSPENLDPHVKHHPSASTSPEKERSDEEERALTAPSGVQERALPAPSGVREEDGVPGARQAEAVRRAEAAAVRLRQTKAQRQVEAAALELRRSQAVILAREAQLQSQTQTERGPLVAWLDDCCGLGARVEEFIAIGVDEVSDFDLIEIADLEDMGLTAHVIDRFMSNVSAEKWDKDFINLSRV